MYRLVSECRRGALLVCVALRAGLFEIVEIFRRSVFRTLWKLGRSKFAFFICSTCPVKLNKLPIFASKLLIDSGNFLCFLL